MIEKNVPKEALTKAIRYLALKDRSVYEMKIYLQRQEFSKETVAKVIEYLQEKKYLDDQVFAKKYIAAKILQKNMGLNKIKAQLWAKRISQNIIEYVSQEYSAAEEYIIARTLVEKKFNKELGGDNWPKIYRFLMNKGFSKECISKIYNQIL